MKKYIAVISTIICVVLSSCSADGLESNELLKKQLLDGNDQYNEYLSVKSVHEDEIDAYGYYISDELSHSESENHDGSIHVSFAEHKLLNVFYYTDPDHKEMIDKENCYLYPGDTIYAKVDFTSKIQSNTYEFQGFQIAVFDGEHSNFNYTTVENEIITIPPNLTYSEISIIPFGEYKKRDLSFKADFIDSEGNPLSISPIWEIDIGEQSYSTKSDHYSVEASSSFRVKAKYDPHEYYLIEDSVEPKFESHSDKDGIVKFPQYNTQDAKDDYKLVFGQKFKIQIDSISASGLVTILVEGNKYDLSVSDFPFVEYAKLGDKVTIDSTGTIYNVGTTHNLTRLTQNGYVYSVCNDESSIEFDPSSFKYDHGKVTFYNSEHKPITEKTELNIGDILYYKGEAEEGYTFNKGDGENKIIVDSNINYMLENALKFNPKQKITLSQPNIGGKIIYFLNGTEIKEESITFSPDSDSLKANFKASDRYKPNNLSDQAECIVSSSDHRIRFKDNSGNIIGIDSVFVLSEEQKANLTVELDESVGTETKFFIYNGKDWVNQDKQSYISIDAFSNISNPLGLDDDELLDNYKMDTVSGIKINVSDWSRLTGEAIRLDVTKTNSLKNKSTETYYILSGSGSQFINTNSGGSTYYTDIYISISKVKGEPFYSTEYTYENANIEFMYNDTSSGTYLRDGDYVDYTRKILVTVTAKSGYQLYKENIIPLPSPYSVIDKYTIDCKYSELNEEFSKMKSKTKISY